MTAPRLSVVAPFYNVARYLPMFLDSLQAQTYTDFEVILVDDGSPDASIDIASATAAKDSRFRIVRQENAGLGAARNTGAAHAEGEYIAFADTDDYVPRHAYQVMVDSLDSTGSQIVAGNVRRFDSASVRPSWSHRNVFAKDRLETHVRDYPQLALDRMIWNKVFRRDFWDEHGLSFPAMLYEDYPVGIKGHVRATSVDVLSQPIYYWRERDGGDLSITQDHASLDNMTDRLLSAEMVLSFLDEEAPTLRPVVEQHLLAVDLHVFAGSFVGATPAERPTLVDLSTRFLSLIGGESARSARPLDQIQLHLVSTGQMEAVETLAVLREEGDFSTRAEIDPHEGDLVLDLPFRDDPAVDVPRSLYVIDPGDLDMHLGVEEASWFQGRLLLDVSATVAHLVMDESASYDVWFEGPNGAVVQQAHTRMVRHRSGLGPDLSLLRLEIDPAVFGVGPRSKSSFWKLRIKIDHLGVTRTGTVTSLGAGRARWLRDEQLEHRFWMSCSTDSDGDFGISLRRVNRWVQTAISAGDQVDLYGTLRLNEPPESLAVVARRRGRAEVTGQAELTWQEPPAYGFQARFELAELLGETPAVWLEAESPWQVQVVLPNGRRTLVVHPDFDEAVGGTPGWAASVTRGNRGLLTLLTSPPHARILEAVVDEDHHLAVHGIADPGITDDATFLLIGQFGPGNPAEHPLTATWDSGHFRFEVPLRELVAAAEQSQPGRAHPRSGHWSLNVVTDGVRQPVVVNRTHIDDVGGPGEVDGRRWSVRYGAAGEVTLVVGAGVVT